MNPLMNLDRIGQSLWLESVTRESLNNGLFKQYIEEKVISGLSISAFAYKDALRQSTVYDPAIRRKLKDGLFSDSLARELVLTDTRHAADLLRPVFDRTDGVDGWSVLTISSLLTSDPSSLMAEAVALYAKIQRPNVLITIPGLPEYLRTIEELIFTGIPINVSMLFSQKQYTEAFEAYLTGIERRISAGLKSNVGCFASIPISHLSAALSLELQDEMVMPGVVAVATSIYKISRVLHTSQRWERASNRGARSLRLMWVMSDGPGCNLQDTKYMDYLTAPCTVAAMPEKALQMFVEKGNPGAPISLDGGDCTIVLSSCLEAGADINDLADRLQKNESHMQIKAWIELLEAVAHKSAVLTEPIKS